MVTVRAVVRLRVLVRTWWSADHIRIFCSADYSLVCSLLVRSLP